MESPLSTTHIPSSREYSTRSSYTRASSRSSTGAQSTSRMSTHASDRSVANVTSSTQPPSHLEQHSQHQPSQTASHIVHRFQNGSNKRASPAPSTSTDSSRFRSLNDSTIELKTSDSKPSLTATSSYLQEKLLKERKVESDRCSSRLSNDKTASTMDLHAAQSSPARPLFDISRPKSSTGHLDSGRKKGGVSLKEMEQTLTTLHKQNFDLKLELYHRREKQSSLEERCEGLETEKRELEDINDKLMSELEMRDKAVEEAVAMIVSLEARMDELLREREMIQQIEKEQFFATDARLRQALTAALNKSALNNSATESDSFDETPKPKTKTADDFTHTINRMPSFMSERSELTENLRNVYLGTRIGSFASLPRMSDDNLDIDRDTANRVGSPTLSVLSESSFLSIYGKKETSPPNITSAPMTSRPMSPVACVPDIQRSMPDTSRNRDNSFEAAVDDQIENSNGSASAVVAHALASTVPLPVLESSNGQAPKKRSNSSSRIVNRAATFNTLTDMLDTNSPLQRLEKMEKSLHAMNEASRPGSQEELSSIEALARHLRQHDIGTAHASKQDKREALRRVRTDAPFARDLNGHHNLPPTPDTISTSTLRRYKNSNDTLSVEKDATNDRSYLALSEENTSRMSSGEKRLSAIESFVDGTPAMQPSSTTAFNSRLHEFSDKSSYFENRLYIPPRPRSADETTTSHLGRGSGWGDSESSDDDMDIDGNDSASLQDYWLRESLRPSGHAPPSTRNRGRKHGGGRISPDLFSFPTTSNGWATTAMFGSLGGTGYQGNPPLAQTLDALGDSLPSPAAGLFGPSGLLASPLPYSMSGIHTGPPPPPHRRSSLHAQTGSSRSGSRHGSAPGTPSLGTPGIGSSKANRRSPTRPGTTATKDSGIPSRTAAQDGRCQTLSQTTVSALDAEAAPPASAPAPQEQGVLPKQRHYPPASGSNGNGASRSRVLSLFRRSGSHEPSSAASQAISSPAQNAPITQAPPSSASATETTFAGAASAKYAEASAFGMPSRVRRGDLEDASAGAGASATPPPIMRNPRNPLRGSVDSGSNQNTSGATEAEAAGASDKEFSSVAAPTTESSMQAAQAQPQDVGQRKRWLGRVTSLRNRAG